MSIILSRGQSNIRGARTLRKMVHALAALRTNHDGSVDAVWTHMVKTFAAVGLRGIGAPPADRVVNYTTMPEPSDTFGEVDTALAAVDPSGWNAADVASWEVVTTNWVSYKGLVGPTEFLGMHMTAAQLRTHAKLHGVPVGRTWSKQRILEELGVEPEEEPQTEGEAEEPPPANQRVDEPEED